MVTSGAIIRDGEKPLSIVCAVNDDDPPVCSNYNSTVYTNKHFINKPLRLSEGQGDKKPGKVP